MQNALIAALVLMAATIVWLVVQVASGGSDAELIERVAALEQEVQALRDQQIRRGGGGDGGGNRGGRGKNRRGKNRAAPDMLDELSLEGDAPGRVLDVLESDDPDVRDRMQDLVAGEVERQREQEREDRRNRMIENQQQRLEDFVSDFDLDDSQRQELSDLIENERTEIFSLFDKARADGSFWEARNQAVQIREATDSSAADFLDEDQLDGYRTMREEMAPRRR